MNILSVKRKIIRDDEDKYSYIFINGYTNNPLWVCPTWYFTREEATKQSEAMQAQLYKDMENVGLPVKKAEDGSTIVDSADIENLRAKAPSDKVTIIFALAMHRETKKFGFVVMSTSGEILLRPKEYYETETQAFEAARTAATDGSVAADLEKLGYKNVVIATPNNNDFVPVNQHTQFMEAKGDGTTFKEEAMRNNFETMFKKVSPDPTVN